ncbi:BTB/POZ domain-containing protein [Cucumis melo var. makuwa]|uniref:BTB/POZ domain-containing protein n=2 Tax=Cucumis melo TaxID=3656 RepID=A0A5D3E6N5_CUCMM|nr:BTB/POZ domain-containing protein [Cucumis melo var. makuwa]TYK31509.1 BTB/POZ domain-containing protein [Cucumis melo var. makuwa]
MTEDVAVDSSGLLQKLVCALLAKIAQNSNGASSLLLHLLLLLHLTMRLIIEKVVQGMGSYGSSNNNFILSKFLLHYLKSTRLKIEQKLETKQLTHTLGGANRLKKEGRADGGKATKEKPTVEKRRKRKRRWKNGRESYGGKTESL